MAKKQKERHVDFSQDEMVKKSRMESRTKFTDTLKRICEMYDINSLDFKVDEENGKSGFFFTPECSELLALLIRHHTDNPLARKNMDNSKISATAVETYNKLMIKDIDTELNDTFRKLIYTMPAHMVSQEIAEWTEPLVRQLTYFLINITTLGNENIGAALREFAKKLDEMNYYLFRGNYAVQMARDINVVQFHDEDNDQRHDINRILGKQNLSIDKLIANMIKWFNVDAKDIRDKGFPDLIDILREKNSMYRLIGREIILANADGKELFKDIKNPSDEELRAAYYSLMIEPNIDEGSLKNNEFVMEHYRKRVAEWKSITDKILDGEFRETSEMTIEKKKEVLKQNIQIIKSDLSAHEEELERLELTDMDEPKNDFLEKLQKDYIEHCQKSNKENKELYNIVDVFVGQVLNEFIK
jgi:hypothetical protein